MEEDFEETSTSKISKINAAGLINLIIADLWRDSYRHSRKGDLSNWNADLNCLWIEFSGDVVEGDTNDEEYKKIEKGLMELGPISRQSSVGFKEITKEDKVNFAKQYNLLLKKAIFLKRLQNKQGKGTAYRDESDDYMD